jgi:hypothetical protein
MRVTTSHRRAVVSGLVASALLTALVIAGSRNLENYDSALFGYTVASVVAFGAVVFRGAAGNSSSTPTGCSPTRRARRRPSATTSSSSGSSRGAASRAGSCTR